MALLILSAALEVVSGLSLRKPHHHEHGHRKLSASHGDSAHHERSHHPSSPARRAAQHHKTALERKRDAKWKELKKTFIKKAPRLTQPEIRDLVRVLIHKNVPVNPKYKREVRRLMAEAVHNDDWEWAQKQLMKHPEYLGKNPVPKHPYASAAFNRLMKHGLRGHVKKDPLRHPSSDREFNRAFKHQLRSFDRSWRRHDASPKHTWFSMSPEKAAGSEDDDQD